MSSPGRTWVQPINDRRSTPMLRVQGSIQGRWRGLRHAPYVKRGLTRKLAQPWHGLYFIVEDISDIVYRIKKENSVLGHQWRGNCSTYCSILSGVQGLSATFMCQETARVGQRLSKLFRNLKALVVLLFRDRIVWYGIRMVEDNGLQMLKCRGPDASCVLAAVRWGLDRVQDYSSSVNPFWRINIGFYATKRNLVVAMKESCAGRMIIALVKQLL